MDIRELRYFLTVAREESFSMAAEVLYLSQPTLSRQIREMEEELGGTAVDPHQPKCTVDAGGTAPAQTSPGDCGPDG
jgi:hypothetical protein